MVRSHKLLVVLTVFYGLIHRVTSKPGKPFFLFPNHHCVTTDCQKLGIDILTSLNYSTQPCADFYTFTCSNYNAQTQRPPSMPFWNRWQELTHAIFTRVSETLRTPLASNGSQISGVDDDGVATLDDAFASSAFSKSRDFYGECVSLERHGKKQLHEMQQLLQKLGGWASQKLAKGRGMKWEMLLRDLIGNTGGKALLSVIVDVDYEDASQFLIYIEPGELTIPISLFAPDESSRAGLGQFRSWMLKTLNLLFSAKITEQQVQELVDFEKKLAKLMYADFGKGTAKYRKVSLGRLVDEINLWGFYRLNVKKMLQRIFANVDSIREIDDDTVVAIKNFDYFRKLLALLMFSNNNLHTPWNYILWHLIYDLSRDINPELRALNFGINKAIYGIEADQSLDSECAEKTIKYFKFAFLPQYVAQQHGGSVNRQNLVAVRKMATNIRQEFVKLINASDWLQSATKTRAMDKVQAIKIYVGYPKFVHNESLLNEYYKHIKTSQSHLLNVLEMKKFIVRRNLLRLGDDATIFDWPINPFTVNAFYSVLRNSIIIPLGIINEPFFSVYRPKVFNYGYLGSIIGHEISHALDLAGINVRSNGGKYLWPVSDWYKYSNRTKCFEQQYNEWSSKSGLTLAENIADNVGLALSYNAIFRNNIHPEMVPFLDTFNQEQLFFISYAQLWCEVSNAYESEHEEHAENKARVLGAVRNSQEFNKFFNCTSDIKTCSMW